MNMPQNSDKTPDSELQSQLELLKEQNRRLLETISQIEEENRQFHDLFSMAPDLTCIVSIDGYFKKLNPAWQTTLGFSLEELLSQPYIDFIHPDDIEKTHHEVESQPKGNGTIHFVNRYRSKSGVYKWLEWRAVHSDDKQFLIAAAKDITLQKEAEEKVSFQAHLLNSVGQAVIAVHTNGTIIYWNKAAETIYGWAEHEVMGQHVSDYVVVPKAKPKMMDMLKILSEGKSWSGEFTGRRKQLKPFYGYGTNTPVFNEQGEVICIIGVSMDISQRKETEQKMKHLQRMMLESEKLARTGSWEWNLLTDTVNWSPEVYRQYQLNPKKHPKPNFSTAEPYIHPDDRDKVRSQIRQAVKSGICPPVEYRLKFPDGTIKHVRSEGTVVRGQNNIRKRVVGFVRDITDIKEMEEQLIQAEKLRAIGQLAGGITHDFNNQLSGILGFAELIKSPKITPEKRNIYVERIISIVNNASDVTSKLLAFSRKGQFQKSAVNIHDMVGEVLGILAHSIDKKIKLQQKLEALPYFTFGDPSHLQNALLNIGINARDAMPEGGTLQIATQSVELNAKMDVTKSFELKPGPYIKITVSDSGIGMDKKTKQQIFEPFFTTKEKGKGTGMGLAAVYGTIKSHHGGIQVVSKQGKGTSVSVFLTALKQIKRPRKQKKAHTKKPKSASILLLDDEEIITLSIELYLKRQGHTVCSFTSPTEALEYYKNNSHKVDLVLLDMLMPELSGKDVFIALKKINPDVKVIMVSGYSLEEELQETLSLGVLDFIEKPFSQQHLGKKISEHL